MGGRKPTYEQLKMRVQDLEQALSKLETAGHRCAGFTDASYDSFLSDAPRPFYKDTPENLGQTILNSISDIVAFYPSPDLKPAWVNQALLKYAGASMEAILSTPCHQCWHQSDTPCPSCPVLKTFETGKPQESEAQTLDGRCWIIRSFPRYIQEGKFEGVIVVAWEITERKQFESKVSQDLEKYRRIFNSTPVGICSYDTEGRIVECNQTCADVMGTTIERLLEFNLLKEIVNADFRQAIVGSLKGRVTHFEGFYTSVTGGRQSFLNVDFAPVYSSAGRIIGGVGVGTDIIDKVSAEIALQESEAKYRSILDNIEDGYYEVDLVGNLTFFNDSLCKMFGYTRSELMGMNYRSFMHADDVDLIFKTFNRVFNTGVPSKGVEWRVIRKDGAVRYLDTSVSLIQDAEGHIRYFGGITRDVTQRRRADEALRASEAKYRSLFESIPVGLYQTTMDGRVVDVNSACLRILKYPGKEELLSRDAREMYVNPEDSEKIRAKLANNGFVDNYEARLRRWDDSMVWISITAHLIYDDYGNVLFIDGSLKDISERKEKEELLRESEIKYRGLAERSSDIIVLTDTAGTPHFWSPSSEQILGYSVDELMAKHPSDLMAVDEYDRMMKFFPRLVDEQQVGNIEVSMTRKDGSEVIIEWTATPVRHENKLTGIQFLGRDITVRKQAEAALQKSHEELRNLSKHLELAREQERRTIAREVHDDLGQLLTAIKFDLAWMKRHLIDRDDSQWQPKIEGVNELANQAIHSVKRISTQLRPEILSDLGLEAAMEWYLGDFQKRTGIDCKLQFSEKEFSEGHLCDELCISIFRIFQEALTNVARHSRASRVTVKVLNSDGWIKLKVGDNGIGISEAQINGSESYGLLGIRERVNAFGGMMEIVGDSGKGTLLRVELPAISESDPSTKN